MKNIYQWLFGAGGKEAMADLANDPTGLLIPHIGSIRATDRPIIAISASDQPSTSPTASQLGGVPWWPQNEAYPIDNSGDPLYLLVQINFAETPALEPFPRQGLLQIFIGADDLYGCDFDDLRKPTGFRCVYHTDLTKRARTDFALLKRDQMDDMGFLPLDAPLVARALEFDLSSMPVDPGDYRFEQLLPDIAASEDLTEAYGNYTAGGAVSALRLGGYPTFTQDDPRRCSANANLGDFTLLTVDTTDGVMWGDSGVAQFFMHEADLRRRDFSRVVYSWDCC